MSGRKNALNKFKIVTQGNMALASVTSAITNIQFLDNIGIQVDVTTGSPTGVFTIEISANYDPNTGSGNWVVITSASVTTGTPGDTYFDLNQLSAPWVRLVYTRTSGTGNFDATIVGKMI